VLVEVLVAVLVEVLVEVPPGVAAPGEVRTAVVVVIVRSFVADPSPCGAAP